MHNAQSSAVAAFRLLHESGCFMLPNPWDRGSARYLDHLGFKALATTSSGFAFSQGMPDDVKVITIDRMLQHFRDMASATSLPVNADFQNGYADDPDDVFQNVRRCVETGVAGLSIEDSTGNRATPLYERATAIERVKAARSAIDQSGVPVILTARCEAWLVGDSNAQQTVLDRLVAYADAGADCLYAPGARDPEDVRAIVNSVAPKPVNALVSSPGLTVMQVAELGVRRISVGSALARVAWGAFINAAKTIMDEGSFAAFGNAASGTELNQLFMPKH
jgi:2-methylisocitrate lyase-like PEP mutase family enzyme